MKNIISTPFGDLCCKQNSTGFSILCKKDGKTIPVTEVIYDETAHGIFVRTTVRENNITSERITSLDPDNGVDLIALRNDIFQEEADGSLEIIDFNNTDILTYDLKEHRDINYHTVKPTTDWIISNIKVMPAVSSRWAELTGDRETIASVLTQIDPVMLICLNKIILTTKKQTDIDAIIDEIQCEPSEIPDFELSLGLFWHAENTIIINLDEIETACNQLAAECHYTDAERTEDMTLCFYTTLIHELRHLGMANPFLPEDEYPEEEKDETAVEKWAQAQMTQLTSIIQNLINKRKGGQPND